MSYIFEKERTKNNSLRIQIEVCELLIDSKNYEIFACNNLKKMINGVIST